MKRQSTLQEDFEVRLRCVRVRQPIGDFYIASIDRATLVQITFADVRRIYGEREIDNYLGIQREVNPKRVKEIGEYVNTMDACFPTAVILAVDGRCAEYVEVSGELILRASLDPDQGEPVTKIQIAKVLDGQHRIEGLRALKDGHVPFDINVSIFIEMDIENQAYLFSVVNLAQTKVSKSLVYDLFEYSRSRSPQKTCHDIAVALDTTPESPLFQKIKRLGVATEGRFTETITQATFVESLMAHISNEPVKDRDAYRRGHAPLPVRNADLQRFVFRGMFLDEKDFEITDVVMNFFLAVRARWPNAWAASGRGDMLNRTNGFRALMRALRPYYLHVSRPGEVPPQVKFERLLAGVPLRDDDFTVERFKPGTSGETELYRQLTSQLE